MQGVLGIPTTLKRGLLSRRCQSSAGLGVGVDIEHRVTGKGETGGQVRCEGGFTHSALLVQQAIVVIVSPYYRNYDYTSLRRYDA